jgi:SnoaL-like domain
LEGIGNTLDRGEVQKSGLKAASSCLTSSLAGGNVLNALQSDIEQLRLEVQRLRAREEIRDRIYGYTRALDSLDRRLLAAQFWPDARVDYGAFYQGSIAGFVEAALRFQVAMRDTRHMVETIQVSLSGDEASVESYVHANHVIIDGSGLVQLSVGARYGDRFERRDSIWKLSFRTEVLDSARWFRLPERSFELARELPKGLRGRKDLSYRFSLPEP